VPRKMGISEQTFYRWKKKFGGLMPSEVRKLRQLEEENVRHPEYEGYRTLHPMDQAVFLRRLIRRAVSQFRMQVEEKPSD